MGSFLSIFVPPFSSLSLWSFGHAIFHSSFQHSRLLVKIIFVLWKPKKKRSKRNRNKSNRSLFFFIHFPIKISNPSFLLPLLYLDCFIALYSSAFNGLGPMPFLFLKNKMFLPAPLAPTLGSTHWHDLADLYMARRKPQGPSLVSER